jgi:outer membrane murein-binding lipoprotein Lpp
MILFSYVWRILMSKNFYKPLLSGLLGLILLAACASAPSAQEDRVKALEEKVNALTAQVTTLNAQVAMSASSAKVPVTGAAAENPFEISVAQFVLDNAGFHGMATSITADKKINASYAGTVSRAYKVLSQTSWPHDLAEQGKAFNTILKDFSTALADNNLDGATKLSEEVHDAQHDLSHAIDDWFGKAANASIH